MAIRFSDFPAPAPAPVQVNAITDANQEHSPKWLRFNKDGHNTHDVGMAFDVQIRPEDQLEETGEVTLYPVASSGDWEDARAHYYVDANAVDPTTGLQVPASGRLQLKNSGAGTRRIAKEIVSLFSLTKSQSRSYSNIPIADSDGKRKKFLFDGILFEVIVGGTGVQKNYPKVRDVLENLGITSRTHKGHDNHFHVYLKPPPPKEIP